jgi:hypothetical protein
VGQRIEVIKATVMDDVLMLDTDRSLTGQDGVAYPSVDAAHADETFPGRLASRLFDSDRSLEHVFVGSNGVVVRRDGGWDDARLGAAFRVVSEFFLFYPVAR